VKVVDSSGWLEYLANGPNAEFFAEPLADPAGLVVPVVSVYEVFKRMLVQLGETAALEAVALMQQGLVVELDAPTALAAAKLSVDHGLPMADAMILAATVVHDATLWTQDQHFERIEGVRYVRKGGE
jgi:predicted nucleic acid-binding protein